jgi:hypothetical protein
MAIVNRMASDLTGKEDEPEKFAQLIIRKGPGIDKALALDVLPEEVDDIDEADGVYVVELKLPGDFQARELLVTIKEFTDKVVTPSGKKLEDVIEGARFLRARRPTGR